MFFMCHCFVLLRVVVVTHGIELIRTGPPQQNREKELNSRPCGPSKHTY